MSHGRRVILFSLKAGKLRIKTIRHFRHVQHPARNRHGIRPRHPHSGSEGKAQLIGRPYRSVVDTHEIVPVVVCGDAPGAGIFQSPRDPEAVRLQGNPFGIPVSPAPLVRDILLENQGIRFPADRPRSRTCPLIVPVESIFLFLGLFQKSDAYFEKGFTGPRFFISQGRKHPKLFRRARSGIVQQWIVREPPWLEKAVPVAGDTQHLA